MNIYQISKGNINIEAGFSKIIEEAYNLGVDAGKSLKKIHNIKVDTKSYNWYDNYLIKQKKKYMRIVLLLLYILLAI